MVHFSKKIFICAFLAATAIMAQLSSASNQYNGPTNQHNKHYRSPHNSQFDDDASYNTNSNNYPNQPQQSSHQTAPKAYQNNVNNCYASKNCNRAYPTNQRPSATYNSNGYNNNNNNKHHIKHSPYGKQKVLPAIYGGNGLFSYKGYARVPARAYATPRPAYGLSLKPTGAVAFVGHPNRHYSSHRVREPIYQPAQQHYRPAVGRQPRRQNRARRARPRPRAPKYHNHRPQQQAQYNAHSNTLNSNHQQGGGSRYQAQRYNGKATNKAPTSAAGYSK